MTDADAPTSREIGRVAATPPDTGDESPVLDEQVALDRVRQRMLGVTEAPSTVGHYRVVGRLGTGGMGVVFDARDDELDRRVAIKILRRELASDTAWRERFMREAQALARLSHPNVVQVYEVGRHDGQIFIAMERVEGIGLRAWCRAAPRSWAEIVHVFVGAGQGLSAAHKAGLVHRDFKPDNLIVDAEGRARVLDFGIVRFDAEPTGGAGTDAPTGPHPSVSGVATEVGTVMGTVAYMAPEQRAAGTIDARADQYAFGLCLYEALHGARPPSATGPEDSTLDAATRSRSLSQTDLRVTATRIDRRVPVWLHEIIVRTLAPAPEDRWPSMDALLAALQRPPRRRLAIAIAATGIVAVGAGALHLGAQARRGTACDDEATVLQTWWTQARPTAEQGLVGTDVSNAQQTWDALAPRVDAYVADWTAMHASTCRATQVDRTRDATLLAASRACLDARRAAVETLVEIWSSATPADVQSAAPAAAGLPVLGPCDDVRALAVAAEDLDDATTKSQRARMFRADASRRAGRVAEALALAEALAAEVEDPALHAAALVLVARFSADMGKLAEAETAYRQAIAEGIAAGRDEIVGEAAAKLVGVVGIAQRRFDDAKWYAEIARAALERAGVADADPRMASMLGNLGTVTSLAGDPAGGLVLHRRALEHNLAALGPEHLDTIGSRDNLAVDYSLLGRREEAEAEYSATLALRERILGTDHPGLVQTLHNLGIALRTRGDFPGALRHHERGLAVLTAIHDPDHPRIADALEALAADHLESGGDAKALDLFTRALEITRKSKGDDNPDVARMLHNRAAALTNLGKSDEALADAREANAMQVRTLGADHPDVSWSLQTIGSILYTRGDYAGSLAMLERGLVIREAVMSPDSNEVALLLTELGRTLAALGRHGDAVARLERAVTTFEKGGQPLAVAHARGALARSLVETGGDGRRARDLAERARATFAEEGQQREATALAEWLADHPAR